MGFYLYFPRSAVNQYCSYPPNRLFFLELLILWVCFPLFSVYLKQCGGDGLRWWRCMVFLLLLLSSCSVRVVYVLVAGCGAYAFVAYVAADGVIVIDTVLIILYLW